MRGRALRLSAPRRLVNDLMKFSMVVPRVTVQRQMNLGPLLTARMALHTRPSWTAIFLKGYALLSQETPELRRAYVKFPWPHLYEYPLSVGSIAHERDHDGEQAVLLTCIKDPEHRSIANLDASIKAARSRPVLEIKEFRRALKFARIPGPLRWLLMWLGLNIGRQRANYFGTFQLSVYSGLGAESLNPLTPLTSLLNYGPISRGRIGDCSHPLRPSGHGWSQRRASTGEVRRDTERRRRRRGQPAAQEAAVPERQKDLNR